MPQWQEYTLPFSREMECQGCGEELIPHIEVSLIHQGMEVKPDGDGEEASTASCLCFICTIPKTNSW